MKLRPLHVVALVGGFAAVVALAVAGLVVVAVVTVSARNDRRAAQAVEADAKATSEAMAQAENSVPVHAPVLLEAFAGNPVSAERVYQGKWLKVRGDIRDVERHGDRVVVTLWDTSRSTSRNVYCSFSVNDPKIEELGLTKPILLLGYCSGPVDGGVGIDNARILKTGRGVVLTDEQIRKMEQPGG